MKEFWKTLAHVALYLFAAVVLAIGVLREYDLMTILAPGNTLLQIASVALFTGGMLVWTITLFKVARGLLQFGIAGLSAIVGLVLSVSAAGVDIWLREELVARPKNFGEIALWLFIGATIYNIVATWVFHVVDPRIVESIVNGLAESKIMETARQLADEKLDQQAHAVADRIANARVQNVMNRVENRETTPDVPVTVRKGQNTAPSPKPQPMGAGQAPKTTLEDVLSKYPDLAAWLFENANTAPPNGGAHPNQPPPNF